MKWTAALVFGVFMGAMATLVSGQGGQATPPPALEPGASPADVEKALIAAPESQRDQATVVKWKKDFTYDTLRKGTNQLICYDRSGFPQQQPFSIQCTSLANLERVAQNMKAEASGDRKVSEAMLSAMEKDGTRIKPQYGSMWHSVAGKDRESAQRHHQMIAVPGATTETIGLPENGRQGGAWIMNAGTSTAHIMMPR
ncbi:MAG: hypothetical protein KA371_01360 [Acidobacteria bacterium]|nr:hypothetical protein [Acidobacteriota bacterium]